MSDASELVAAGGSQDSETELDKFGKAMKEMPKDMMIFSKCLRSLYVEKAVGTNHEAAVKFRQLRDDTRNDAIVYMRGILPLSKQLISAIKSFLEYYINLRYEEWVKCIPKLVEKAQGYRQLCEAVIKMHEDIIVPLKMREDQAKLVMKELHDLQEEFKKKKMELESSAGKKVVLAYGLFFIPYVNAIAIPLLPFLQGSAQNDMANAQAKGAEAQTQEAAALAVQECLIPALQGFIGGLQKAAGFFEMMEDELSSFTSLKGKNTEKVRPKHKIREWFRKARMKSQKPNEAQLHHFTMTSKKANELKTYCQAFVAALPSVRTEFQAIPTEGTDQNYVDRWLAKQQKIIEETCTERVKAGVMEVMSGIYKLEESVTGGDL